MACQPCSSRIADKPGQPPEVLWLGLRWVGVPWPVRIMGLWWGLEDLEAYAGCGCLAAVKEWLSPISDKEKSL